MEQQRPQGQRLREQSHSEVSGPLDGLKVSVEKAGFRQPADESELSRGIIHLNRGGDDR